MQGGSGQEGPFCSSNLTASVTQGRDPAPSSWLCWRERYKGTAHLHVKTPRDGKAPVSLGQLFPGLDPLPVKHLHCVAILSSFLLDLTLPLSAGWQSPLLPGIPAHGGAGSWDLGTSFHALEEIKSIGLL